MIRKSCIAELLCARRFHSAALLSSAKGRILSTSRHLSEKDILCFCPRFARISRSARVKSEIFGLNPLAFALIKKSSAKNHRRIFGKSTQKFVSRETLER